MIPSRGVSCPACGASTPLPADLRTPTFVCLFCKASLETARFAGAAAVSADALAGYIRGAASGERPVEQVVREAPRFEGESTATRASHCTRCKAPVLVPMALTVRSLTCAACGAAQPVSAHVSDQERLAADMARQMEGNAALKRARQEGLSCKGCGGHNPVPPEASLQFPCRFCGVVVLLTDHVDASAVARHRLAGDVFAFRDELVREAAARDRKLRNVILAVVGVVVLAVGVAALVSALGSR